MSTLLIVRHAQASFGADDYDQLSELGYTQSEHLAQWLQKQPKSLDRIVCGPCKRHKQTAEASLKLMPNIPQDVEIIDELDEFDAFRLFGWLMQRDEDPRSEKLRHLMLNRDQGGGRELGQLLESLTLEWARGDYVVPGMPTWKQTRLRMEAGIQKIRTSIGSGEHVALFTSGGPVGVAIGQALELSDEKTMKMCWAVYNASISRFFVNGSEFSLDSINNLPHLQDESLITRR